MERQQAVFVDSIHTARIGEEVFVPGCRDNPRLGCLHMHWRWGSNLIPIFPGPNTDPLVDPITQIRLPESQRGIRTLSRAKQLI